MVERVFSEVDVRMTKSTEVLTRELSTIRTGRASPALIEHLLIECYGTTTPLKQLATITVPEDRLLMIQPWDKQILPAIERSLLKSDLGLNPVNDGNALRLAIPPLSEERRREMVRLVKRRVEEGKVAVRNIRRDALERLREIEKNKEVSQDDLHRALDRLQKLADGHISTMDKLGQQKESEVMEV